jgi:hypothetical protein
MFAIVSVVGPVVRGFQFQSSAEEALPLYQAAWPECYLWVEEVCE